MNFCVKMAGAVSGLQIHLVNRVLFSPGFFLHDVDKNAIPFYNILFNVTPYMVCFFFFSLKTIFPCPWPAAGYTHSSSLQSSSAPGADSDTEQLAATSKPAYADPVLVDMACYTAVNSVLDCDPRHCIKQLTAALLSPRH